MSGPSRFLKLPIKWKLTLWSSLLLFLVFIGYNSFQYFFVEKWMFNQEQQVVQQTMREFLNYTLEKEQSFEEEDLTELRSFLEKINQRNQMIRILDEEGKPIVVVSENFQDITLPPLPPVQTIRTQTQEVRGDLLIMSSPLTIFQFNGTVMILKNMKEFEQLSGALFQVMAIGCLTAVIISGLGGRLLARQLLRPLQSMNETMSNVRQIGFHERVQFHDNQDEIATLMKMFNKMMDQVERSFLQQRQFVEDASHELRTPIAIIEGHLGMLRRWGKNDPAVLEESLQTSIQELARLKGLVQELLVLTRAEHVEIEEDVALHNPDRAVCHMIKKFATIQPTFTIEQELGPLAGEILAISEEHLEQVLLILLDNAVKYSGESRRICVRAMVQENVACMEIIDEGIGIPEQDLPYVLDRLYRVDKARNSGESGYGLGLAIAKRLLARYNGSITIQSVEQKGTTVTVFVPLRQ
ncbi:cell wall metabolism sensor histidine kinase WalK [Brevibacillus sp. DP1.3A]|uniref:sensor histidine kinase n=1 Tax=Brevibacillus sp. DP1.3A TaxID=2738867 RepID=UPI00156A9304|nr:HAMP domain-containing histidine kinase [Brevibacillus sp. DP1.3A]UED74178.1 HAMP domain-containing histidine kinase [Brevibacillus sp. DP1.3A]